MDFESPEPDALRELHDTLHLLLLRLTRRAFGTPRQMQMDVGNAISILHRVEHPRSALLARILPDLLRELGKRRPDLRRYVMIVEESVHDLREALPPPPPE